jgi:lipid II:glycine glycyltransferase (peptidoglycan interpeptide bridge formation enzyme)
MEIKKIEILEDNYDEINYLIDDLLNTQEYSSIWQTIQWNKMLKKSNYIKKGIFLWIYDNNKLKSYLILEKRLIWFWFFWLFCIWWPIFDNEKYIQILLESLEKITKEEKVVFTQIESIKWINTKNFKTNFKEWYYKNFIIKDTIFIDLKQNEEEIFKNMKPKGRYNIRLAEKNNVIVKMVDNNSENLDIFYNLILKTSIRDKFTINSKLYFREFLDYLYKNNLWWLYFAKKNNIIIASWIFVFFKKIGFYYYWASLQNEYKKFMSPYLIQWEAIKESKNKWCLLYDFLWASFTTKVNNSLKWVTEFKLKFSSNTYKFPNTLIYINNKFIFVFLKIRLFLKYLYKK